MAFQITALDHAQFAMYFEMTEEELSRHMAVRVIATENPGFPCRVSLKDAEVGDELVLVNYQHQDAASPYRAAHAIYVRKGVKQAHPKVGEAPELFRKRAISLRAFDQNAMIVKAELLPNGMDLEAALHAMFAMPSVNDVHIHFATYGCFAARAKRA